MVAEPPTPVHRFSLEEYHRLIESGAFDEDTRMELIDGLLVDMSPKWPGLGAGGELVASRLNLPPISVAELLAAAG